jgi:hypothetical protein
MLVKDIEKITEADLQTLIDNSVLEHKRLEYKRSLPSDSDKREFLADVSSFANASGGDIIYGIIEDRETGIPKALEGVVIENVDQEISRLENMIRDGIEPRIIGIDIKDIPLSNSKIALIVRVPKSWIMPHRVSFQGHDKFYSRSTNGKYPLDVAELRIAFNLSETITERIRKFREDRISKILADESPIPMQGNPKIVLHLLPIISFNPAQSYDISKISSQPAKMPQISVSGCDYYRYNLDGFLTYSGSKEEKSWSYSQLFKNGLIEAVDASLLGWNGEKKLIPSVVYEEELIKSFINYLLVLKTLNVEPPILMFLTLLGVKGYQMALDTMESLRSYRYGAHTIDRDVLLLPEIVIESYDVIAEKVLRPCFDSIWNACGLPRSLNYDDTGKWVEKNI